MNYGDLWVLNGSLPPPQPPSPASMSKSPSRGENIENMFLKCFFNLYEKVEKMKMVLKGSQREQKGSQIGAKGVPKGKENEAKRVPK